MGSVDCFFLGFHKLWVGLLHIKLLKVRGRVDWAREYVGWMKLFERMDGWSDGTQVLMMPDGRAIGGDASHEQRVKRAQYSVRRSAIIKFDEQHP